MRASADSIRIEKARWALLFLLAVTILGMAINGYRYGYSDQSLYIPKIEQAANPALFPDDYLFDEPSGDYSFWVPAMALLSRLLPLEWLFFGGHLLTLFGLFWAIYHVSLNLFDSRGAAVLAVLFLLAPIDVGGTATATQGTFFTLRSTAMPLAIAFLIPYFNGRTVPAAALCALAFLVHPITALPLVLLLISSLAIQVVRGDRRAAARAAAVFLVGILPLVVRFSLIRRAGPSTTGLLSRLDPEWLEMIRWRNGYIFTSSWSSAGSRSLGLFLAALIGVLAVRWWYSPRLQEADRVRLRQTDLRSIGVIAVCLTLLLIGIVFVEWFPLPLVVQLQVLRGFYLLVNLSLIYLAWIVWTGARLVRPDWSRGVVAGALIGGTLAVVTVSALDTLGRIDFPGQPPRDDWVDVGHWCRDNTPLNALFLVPPEGVQGFRIHSRRGMVGDWKDGAPLVFSRRYADEWWTRMGRLWGYDSFDEVQFVQLSQEYGASFAITRKDQRLAFPVLYENSEFVVYALNRASGGGVIAAEREED